MTTLTATGKTGRVTKLSDVKGVMEYRFVPKDWDGPPAAYAHVCWFVFDPVKHADEYAKVKADMIARRERLKAWVNEDWDGTGRWFSTKGGPWVAKVTYDEVERPILVLIGNI